MVASPSKLKEPIPKLLSMSPLNTHCGSNVGLLWLTHHMPCSPGAAPPQPVVPQEWPPCKFWAWRGSPAPSTWTPPWLIWDVFNIYLFLTSHILPSPRSLDSKEETRTYLLFPFSLSSALPPWTGRIFYFQKYGNFYYVIFSLLYSMVQIITLHLRPPKFTLDVQMEAFWNSVNTFLSLRSMNSKTLSLFT